MYSSEIKLVHTHLYGYVDAWAAEPTCMHTYMYVQYIYTHTPEAPSHFEEPHNKVDDGWVLPGAVGGIANRHDDYASAW